MMKKIILLLSILFFLVSAYAVEVSTAADLSQDHIYSVSKNVKNYVELNDKLPNYVRIGSQDYSMSNYEYLICKSIVAKNSGKSSNIQSKNVISPSIPSGDSISQTITKSQYVTLSKNVVNYIDKNGQAPNYVTLGSKKIQYQTFVYGVSKIGAYINTNKKLPLTLSLNIKNTHSLNKNLPKSNTINTKSFLISSSNVKNWIDYNKKLPSYVTIINKQYTMASYMAMASNTIASYSKGALNNNILIQLTNNPVNSKGDKISISITNSQYYDMAQRTSNFIVKNNRAPSTVALGKNDISYQDSIYLFSKVLDYFNKNGIMPRNIQLNSI